MNSNNSSMAALAVVAIILLVGGFVWFQSSSTQSQANTETEQTAPEGVSGAMTGATASTSVEAPASSETAYTMAEVAAHKDSSSCWSAIDGNVYDLSNWVPKHPGGRQAILGLCGIDGTEKFHGQHGDNKQQADALATMKIGIVKK